MQVGLEVQVSLEVGAGLRAEMGLWVDLVVPLLWLVMGMVYLKPEQQDLLSISEGT